MKALFEQIVWWFTCFVFLVLIAVTMTQSAQIERLSAPRCIESIAPWPVEREIVCAPGAVVSVDTRDGEVWCQCPGLHREPGP